MLEKRKVVDSKDSQYATLNLREDGITEIVFQEEYELDVPAIEQLQHDMRSFMGERPLFLLVIPGPAGSITNEARQVPMFTGNTEAIAVVTKLLHQRILGKLYFKVKNKMFSNYDLFKTKEAAEKWLLSRMTHGNSVSN